MLISSVPNSLLSTCCHDHRKGGKATKRWVSGVGMRTTQLSYIFMSPAFLFSWCTVITSECSHFLSRISLSKYFSLIIHTTLPPLHCPPSQYPGRFVAPSFSHRANTCFCLNVCFKLTTISNFGIWRRVQSSENSEKLAGKFFDSRV